jgi:hypothetical protein
MKKLALAIAIAAVPVAAQAEERHHHEAAGATPSRAAHAPVIARVPVSVPVYSSTTIIVQPQATTAAPRGSRRSAAALARMTPSSEQMVGSVDNRPERPEQFSIDSHPHEFQIGAH